MNNVARWSLRPSLARLLASLRRRGADVARRPRSRYREGRCRCLEPALPRSAVTRCGGEYPASDQNNQWTDRNFASTALIRNPRAQVREPQTVGTVDDEEEEKRKGGFLADARETILVLARIAVVTSVITTLLAAYLVTRLTRASSFPAILRKGIEFLGPIFVKLGQWISTRRDIFPRDVCDTLSQLQRNATPHPWRIRSVCSRRRTVLPGGTYSSSSTMRPRSLRMLRAGIQSVDRSECDTESSDVVLREKALDENDEFALASPRTRKLQTVAVKVLHPGIEDQLKRDIAIMRGLSKCATYFIPKLSWLSLTDCINEFTRIMEDQVDMRLEAFNLARFSANFSKRNDIVFPYPYTHLTHHKILVESFHEGSPISDYLEHDDAVLQRRLAKIGIATILKMIFKDNFIHCDLHPGNILVEKVVVPKASLLNIFRRVITPDYVTHDLRLIILDCGLVVSLNDRCRQNLRDVFYSVLIGNGEMAAQYILEHSSHMTPDPEGFKCSLKNIVKSHLCNPFNINVSTVMSELFSAMVRHQVKQDGSFSSVILSMLVIEGLGRCLDPDVNIFTELLPYVLSSAMNKEILNRS